MWVNNDGGVTDTFVYPAVNRFLNGEEFTENMDSCWIPQTVYEERSLAYFGVTDGADKSFSDFRI